MTPTCSRRDFVSAFLRGAGCFTVAATLPFTASCGVRERPSPGRYRFPQGLASGDPLPDAVVLWTRVEAVDGSTGPVEVVLQVSRTDDFGRLVAERTVAAGPETDHTVRVLVTDLSPDTLYHYRFLAGGDVTPLVGRTRTAPLPEADRPVRLAFASCQAWEAGYYGVWRTLLNEDAAAPQGDRLDFVLHLGDFIYETAGYGTARALPPFPSGGGSGSDGGSGAQAVTLEDYRHLYRTYLSDPDLQEARARWPFVVTWDDHEFADDAWQSVSTEDPVGRPAQERKVAANQAWFEFIPALLTGHPGSSGVASGARDFQPVDVRTTPLSGTMGEDGLDPEPNNRAAVDSLVIHRSFRWGRHLELAVADTRSRRSEPCVPGPVGAEISGSPRYLLPEALVRVLDAGREANGGRPPARIRLGALDLPNHRRDAPPGTLLGPEQREWLRALLRASDATWKLVGSSVPMMPLRLDLDRVDPGALPSVFTIDSWDGYPGEREALLGFVQEEGIRNLVVLSGDHHSHFAGLLLHGSEAPDPPAVGAEFSVAAISSPTLWSTLEARTRDGHPLRPLVVHDTTRHGGSDPSIPALNLTFLHGGRAALVLDATGDPREALAARNPGHNPHLRYADTAIHGAARALCRRDRMEVEFLGMAPPLLPRGHGGEPPLRRVRFTLRSWADGRPPVLEGPEIQGPPPFPLAPPEGGR